MGIFVTVWAIQSGAITSLMESTAEYGILSAFVSGLMYSTFVTIAFSVAGFLALADTAIPLWQMAVAGAIGATIADLLLVREVRSPLALVLVRAVFGTNVHVFRGKRGPMRWIAALFGAALIAAPTPTDELGVVLLGASHLNSYQLVPIVFIADFVGIYVLLTTAQALL